MNHSGAFGPGTFERVRRTWPAERHSFLVLESIFDPIRIGDGVAYRFVTWRRTIVDPTWSLPRWHRGTSNSHHSPVNHDPVRVPIIAFRNYSIEFVDLQSSVTILGSCHRRVVVVRWVRTAWRRRREVVAVPLWSFVVVVQVVVALAILALDVGIVVRLALVPVPLPTMSIRTVVAVATIGPDTWFPYLFGSLTNPIAAVVPSWPIPVGIVSWSV